MPTDEIVKNGKIIAKQYHINDLNNLKPYNNNFDYLAFTDFSSTNSNIPTANSGIVICGGYDINNYYQLAICDSGKLFARHCSFGNWRSWVEK